MLLDTFGYLIRKPSSRYVQFLKRNGFNDATWSISHFYDAKEVVPPYSVGGCIFLNHVVRSLQILYFAHFFVHTPTFLKKRYLFYT